jgi:hypothetical protein
MCLLKMSRKVKMEIPANTWSNQAVADPSKTILSSLTSLARPCKSIADEASGHDKSDPSR